MMAAQSTHSSAYALADLLSGICIDEITTQSEVTGLCLDSRQAKAGDLFIACPGSQQHGLTFAKKAVDAGAVAVVYELCTNDVDSLPVQQALQALLLAEVELIKIDNLRDKLGLIAARFYDFPSKSMHVIGITGTNGKTSCSLFLAQVLSEQAQKAAVIGTLGNGVFGKLSKTANTTPDAISVQSTLASMHDQGVRHVAMEVSSHGLEQGRVNEVIFNTAVFTNLSRDHLDYHGDMQRYAQSKQRLFKMQGLRTAVLNVDDECGREFLTALPEQVQSVAYSLANRSDEELSSIRQSIMHLGCVKGSQVRFTEAGLQMHISSPWGDGELNCPIFARFNASNILAVLTTSLLAGIGLEDALFRISKLRSIPGRMQKLETGASHPDAIVDYAHTPDALRQALAATKEHYPAKVWCVFGCGGDRDKGKRPLMGAVAAQLADHIILTDDNPRTESSADIIADIKTGIHEHNSVHVEADRYKAITYALANAAKEDIVLIAGKGHEDYQLIGATSIPFSDEIVVRNFIAGEDA